MLLSTLNHPPKLFFILSIFVFKWSTENAQYLLKHETIFRFTKTVLSVKYCSILEVQGQFLGAKKKRRYSQYPRFYFVFKLDFITLNRKVIWLI